MVKNKLDLVQTNSEESFSDFDEQLNGDEEFKGALKITRIRNRKYVRMPNFSKRSVNILKNWLNAHLENPYPTHKEKDQLSRESGLSKKQIQNWFTNARKRIWQPMMKSQECKDIHYPQILNHQSALSFLQNNQGYHIKQDFQNQGSLQIGLTNALNTNGSFLHGSFLNNQVNSINNQYQQGNNCQNFKEFVSPSFQENNIPPCNNQTPFLFNKFPDDNSIYQNQLSTHVHQGLPLPKIITNVPSQHQQINQVYSQVPISQNHSVQNQCQTFGTIPTLAQLQMNNSSLQQRPLFQNTSLKYSEPIISQPLHRPQPFYLTTINTQVPQIQTINANNVMVPQYNIVSNENLNFEPQRKLFMPSQDPPQQIQIVQSQPQPQFNFQL